MTSVILFSGNGELAAQEEKVLEEVVAGEADGPALNFGADLMSRYIWRGIDFGNAPAIQPNLAFTWKGLNAGVWGSYGLAPYSLAIDDTTIINMGNYAETDFYVSYTYKWFTVMVFDFFLPNGLNPNDGNRFYDFNNKTTGHTIEGSISFNGTEGFPMQILVGTLLWGADKDKDADGNIGFGEKNNYSTYAEINYNFELEKLKMSLKPFLGASLKESAWYGKDPGIINAGFTVRKEITVTPTFSIPAQLSLITNPQAERFFFVFGITL
jgi:hypothetical protein